MASEAAALLDELMGAQRNALPGQRIRETKWSDPEVCRHFLCGFCPSELFTNTKSDIGPCDKLHDERLKNMYQESERCGKLGYEDEFLHYLEKIVRDLDRRIERGRERLQKSVSAKQKVLQGESGISSDKLKALNDEINLKVTELDHLGTLGQVEEAQQLMKRVEELEKERERERMHLVNMTHKRLGGFDLDAHDFHEKMELCDVCGSFLVIGDVQLRVDAHLLGKQHLGFARIRATIADLKKAKEDKLKKRHGEESEDQKNKDNDDKDADKDAGDREKGQDEKEKHNRGGKSWRVSRDSRSSRSRSRERDHGRQLPRSRDQRPKSPERESRKTARSRSRDRDGNRRRSRSRSRGKEQPSRRHRSKERRDEKQRSRSRSRERRKEEDRSKERPKERDGRERERPREDRSREERTRDDRGRDRESYRSGKPREREERDRPKDGSVKDTEESR